MKSYIKRMIKEQEELEGRIERLNGFILHNPQFSDLSEDEQRLMIIQLTHMNNYLATLKSRITMACFYDVSEYDVNEEDSRSNRN